MDKKLPGVFVNKIDKKLTNNKTVYYGGADEKVEKKVEEKKVHLGNEPLNIKQKLNQVFKSVNYIYKIDVMITLKDKTVTKKIIGYNDRDVITFDNELIPIADILDIEVAK